MRGEQIGFIKSCMKNWNLLLSVKYCISWVNTVKPRYISLSRNCHCYHSSHFPLSGSQILYEAFEKWRQLLCEFKLSTSRDNKVWAAKDHGETFGTRLASSFNVIVSCLFDSLQWRIPLK